MLGVWEQVKGVFPARAGMSRGAPNRALVQLCVPRASGDEPAWKASEDLMRECSPRERG